MFVTLDQFLYKMQLFILLLSERSVVAFLC